MEFSSFTFLVTDECNYDCTYCYQKKGSRHIDTPALEKAFEFFLPFLSKKCYINISGGEPLLAFDTISALVDSIDHRAKYNRQFLYSLTTNGSLLNEHILKFLDHHRFSLILSFDGLAQNISRDKDSFDQTVSNLGRIMKYPNIELQTNSVFTSRTVGYLSDSIQMIMKMGVPAVNLSLSSQSDWDGSTLTELEKELQQLKQFCLLFFGRYKQIPLTNFRKSQEKGIFFCSAGQDRMTLTVDEKLWGCHLFADYFKGREREDDYDRFCFGDLGSFIRDCDRRYPEIVQNYLKLRMDHFYTPDVRCRNCDRLETCSVCPINAAFSSSKLGKITESTCRIKNIINQQKELFWQEIKKSEPRVI